MPVCGEAVDGEAVKVWGVSRSGRLQVPSQCREGVVEERVASRSPALGQSGQTHAPLTAASNLTQEPLS